MPVKRRRGASRLDVALVAVLAVAGAIGGCSGGGAESPTAPTPPVSATPPPTPAPVPPAPAPPPLTATVVITSNNTFAPSEVTIAVGGRVTFTNQNNRAHDIASDPLHLHTDCPPIFDVGFIQPGQTKQTGALTVARVCGFHDHMQENNPDLHGRIIVQ
jgi:plastocyanin